MTIAAASATFWSFLGVFLAALLAAGGTYLLGRRTKSGRIDTSEAETLWKEGTTFRQELRADRDELRAEVTTLRAEVTSLRGEVVTMRANAVIDHEERQALHEHAVRCDHELAKLQAKYDLLSERVEANGPSRALPGDGVVGDPPAG